MLDQLYPENGIAERTDRPAFPRYVRPKQVLDVLTSTYNVPAELIEELAEAFGRAAKDVVDDAVAQRKQPLGYFIVRHFDVHDWWKH